MTVFMNEEDRKLEEQYNRVRCCRLFDEIPYNEDTCKKYIEMAKRDLDKAGKELSKALFGVEGAVQLYEVKKWRHDKMKEESRSWRY